MGVLDSLASGASSGFGKVQDQLSPSSLIGDDGGFSTSNMATDLLGGSISGALAGAMGIDDCPGGAGGGSSSSSSSNDPCGGSDNELKKAVLGLGMALAGPSIAEAGNMIGGALDSELGTASSFLGDGIASGVDALGMSPENSSIMTGALGAGVGGVIGGASGTESATAALNSGAVNISNKNISGSSDTSSKNMFEKIKDMSTSL